MPWWASVIWHWGDGEFHPFLGTDEHCLPLKEKMLPDANRKMGILKEKKDANSKMGIFSRVNDMKKILVPFLLD